MVAGSRDPLAEASSLYVLLMVVLSSLNGGGVSAASFLQLSINLRQLDPWGLITCN